MKSYEERLPLIKQAIKDLHWDLGNTWGGLDTRYNLLYQDTSDYQYLTDSVYTTCSKRFQYICTVDEFYNYGGDNKQKALKVIEDVFSEEPSELLFYPERIVDALGKEGLLK